MNNKPNAHKDANIPERCVSAAVRFADGTTIEGRRHGNCLQEGAARNIEPRGRFVTREEGRALQDAAGIASADPHGYRDGTLFSEDLY